MEGEAGGKTSEAAPDAGDLEFEPGAARSGRRNAVTVHGRRADLYGCTDTEVQIA
jgi:hypothetical protein